MTDERTADSTEPEESASAAAPSAESAPQAGKPPQQPRVEVVFVEEPTADMAELVELEELIPDDGIPDPEPAPQPRSGDFVASVLLGVLLLVVTAVLLTVGLVGFSAQAIACDGSSCNDFVVSLGSQILAIGVPVLALATIVVTVVRLLRRELAFPVVLIGLVACLIVFAVASFLVSEAVPG